MLYDHDLSSALKYACAKDSLAISTNALGISDTLSLTLVVDFGGEKCKLEIQKAANASCVVKGNGIFKNVNVVEIIITFTKNTPGQFLLSFFDATGNNIFESIPDGPVGMIFNPQKNNHTVTESKALLVASVNNFYICILAFSKRKNKADQLLTLRFKELCKLGEAFNMLLLAADIDLRNFASNVQNLIPESNTAEALREHNTQEDEKI